jgi:hypothetical protein
MALSIEYMHRLMKSARRPSEGKPLDRIRGLNFTARGHNMRNTRLFHMGGDHFQVRTWRNVIANIVGQPDGDVLITTYNTQNWCTNTTAERLCSVLGVPVYRRSNAIRCGGFDNFTWGDDQRFMPPLFEGQKILQRGAQLFCLNPEIMNDQSPKRVGDMPKAREITKWVRGLKKHMTLLAKLDALTWADVTDAPLTASRYSDLTYGEEITHDTVVNSLQLYMSEKLGLYQYNRLQKSPRINTDKVDDICKYVRLSMYHANDVYVRDTLTYDQYFTKVEA